MKSFILAFFSFAFVFAYAEENQPAPKSTYHRFYFGPDAFGNHIHARFFGLDISGHNVFTGLRIGHDFVKPDAFYSGSEGLVAGGKTFVKVWSNLNNYKYHRIRGDSSNFIANLEQRFGYTFERLSNKTTLSPFFGVGLYYFKNCILSADWFYAATGLRCNHDFTDNFNLGLNLKTMYKFAGDDRNVWGVQIDLPFRWYLGSSKKGDVQLEPYYLNLDVRSREGGLYGVRLLVGYNF